ncbi:MAG TPA: glutaminase [Terrimicrobiaceae bacterium]
MSISSHVSTGCLPPAERVRELVGEAYQRFKERIIDAVHCQHVLAVMVTAGLYENSGDWLYETGLPGKSGVSGGIVTVSPGKGGLGAFAPLSTKPATASKAS